MAAKTLIWTFAAASAAALLWFGRGLLDAPVSPKEASVSPAPQRGTADLARVAAGAPPAPPAIATATTAATPPPGVAPEQWAALLAELKGRPDAAAETERLRAYFEWSDAVQRWRGARDDPALAGAVDAGLSARLDRREVSAAEARLLEAALLETLEPDPSRRLAALQAFDAGLPTAAGPDARQRQFQQRQAALVATWQARPAAERDPAALARQLEALRRTHFAQNPASAPGR